MRRLLQYGLRFLGLVVGLVLWRGPAAARPPAPTLPPDWETDPPGLLISVGADNGAKGPTVQHAPDGMEVLIAFVQEGNTDFDRDPTYSRSADGGLTWSAPAPIYQSPGVDSIQVTAAYDTAAGLAHAAWVENMALLYASETNWPNAAVPISSPNPPGVSDPVLIASAAGYLNLVWAEDEGSNPDIRFARSLDGGATWPILETVAATTASSLTPDVAVDDQGLIHVVWQESVPPHMTNILYSQGAAAGLNVAWSAPVAITGDLSEVRQPRILAVGNELHVTYTTFAEGAQQWIHHVVCATQCSDPTNWQDVGNPISGQAMGANASDPYEVTSSLAYANDCLYVYFHGTEPNSAYPDNEVISGVNSCDGWSANGRDRVTEPQTRAIFPSIAILADRLLLTYEWVNGGDHQIYLMRADLPPDYLYLPVIVRNP
ncbi:MAG: hypothetical protein AB1791_10415 [Chloroflexota bacterium]